MAALGNVKSFIYTPTVTVKDHFSKMSPIRAIDLSVVSQVAAEVKMELEELNDFNLGLFLLAEGTSGDLVGLTAPTQQGTLHFTGTNSIGAKLTFSGLVQLQPGGDFNLLADNDDFAALPISAKVLFSAGGYGHWTTNGVTAPNTVNYSITQGTVDYTPGTA